MEGTVPDGYPEPGLFQQSLGWLDENGRSIRYQFVYYNDPDLTKPAVRARSPQKQGRRPDSRPGATVARHAEPPPYIMRRFLEAFHSLPEIWPQGVRMKLGRLVWVTLVGALLACRWSRTRRKRRSQAPCGITRAASCQESPLPLPTRHRAPRSWRDRRAGAVSHSGSAGVYRVTAELSGFATIARPGVEILLGRQVALEPRHGGVGPAGDRDGHRRSAAHRHDDFEHRQQHRPAPDAGHYRSTAATGWT